MKSYEKLDEALQLAAKLHLGQRRDGELGLPYAVHPFEVVSNLRYVGEVTDEEMLIAAALHDVLEETEAKASKLREMFGKRVADLVKELTREEPKKKDLKDLAEEEVWELRSSLLLTEISKMSHKAQTLKLADRLSNIREAVRVRSGDRLERYRVQTFEILETIPREVNPRLWDAVKAELSEATA
jgi:(p)ppGpp synthase/HD superfamily hydrolase